MRGEINTGDGVRDSLTRAKFLEAREAIQQGDILYGLDSDSSLDLALNRCSGFMT